MPALLTTMSSRPCRSTISPGAVSTAAAVGDVEAQRLGAHARPRVSSSAQVVGVIAARRGDHRRALLGEPRGNRAPDSPRRTGHERHFAGELKHVDQSGSIAARSSGLPKFTTVASR